MYAAADEVSDYAVKQQQARFQPIGTTIPDPRPAPRYVPTSIVLRSSTARSAISDKDISEALEFMFKRGELSEEMSERIDDVAASFAEKRINSGDMSKPNGSFFGLAQDACAALRDVVVACRRPPMDHTFSEVDVDRWAAICKRAGYSL
jgi:hypothetical protein